MSKSKFVVSSNGYFFDWETCVLYMGYRFSVKASAMTGDEYRDYLCLLQCRKKHCG